MADDSRLAILETFGLSGYQARAYLALLELGASQAREVSERSGVPQGRVYDILEKLAARGLVEVLPEAPRRFRAVPFEVFLERELHMHRERIEVLERDRGSIVAAMAPAGEPPPVGRGEYVVVRGRKSVEDRVAEVLGAAQRDVLLAGTELVPRRVAEARDVVEKLAARGVRVRVLAAVGQANAEDVRACLSAGAEVQHFGGLQGTFPRGLQVLVADGARAVLYQQPGDDAHRGEDVALVMEHPPIVQGLGALAEAIWALATPAAERLQQLSQEQPGAWQGQTVLIVDDEPDILQSLQELLEASLGGIRVVQAARAEDALRVLTREPVDVVITDYKMPGMSGLELLEQAQKIAPGVRRIMITAFPDVRVATRAINDARVDHFFVKPLPDARVVDVVRDVLEARRSRRLREDTFAGLLDRQPEGASGAAGSSPPAL